MKDQERKKINLYQVFEFFPDAMMEIGRVISAGQSQHIAKGLPPTWNRNTSNDHLGSLTRHLCDYARGEKIDDDDTAHLGKVVFRALAQLQLDKEAEGNRENKLDGDISWGPNKDHHFAEARRREAIALEQLRMAEDNDRMKHIGQNGNTGDHYNALKSVENDL